MEITFTGKRALVTGAGKGIGRATALALARCGAQVTAVTRAKNDLDSLVQGCPSIKPVCVDLSDWDATEHALKGVGPVDLLVNNAGCAKLQPFLEITQDQFDMSFNVNVKAALHVAQIVAIGMKTRGTGGSIVNVSSQASQCAFADHAVYCATKGALDMLTKVMALELGPFQIRVNSVNPTVVMTEMGKKGWSDPVKAKSMTSRIPLGKFADTQSFQNRHFLGWKASVSDMQITPVVCSHNHIKILSLVFEFTKAWILDTIAIGTYIPIADATVN